jgi:perosamine synthetase
MNPGGRPAAVGGRPIRVEPLPYGRHSIDKADIAAVVDALESGILTGGRTISAFEAALAERCGVEHAVAVCNGTAALHLAVAAVGVGDGDEVITTPLTFVATANSIRYTGGRPQFADIGSDRNLDAAAVARTRTEATRAVIAVDYSGLPADVDAIREAAPGIPVVVDAAHSLGGLVGDRPAGSLGDVSTLSFHPVKHVTTGEGGACLTDDPELADRMRRLRNHGMTSDASARSGDRWKYDVTELGSNYRMTDFQAALGASQLKRLDANLRRRAMLASRYDELLAELPGVNLPPRRLGRTSAWHIYPIEIDPARFGWSRDEVIDGLRSENIQATLHYPAVHMLSSYRAMGYAEGLAPIAEAACAALVTLPLFPGMTEADQDDVVFAIRRLAEWKR